MSGMIGLIVNTRGRTHDFRIPSYKRPFAPRYFAVRTVRVGLADYGLSAKSGRPAVSLMSARLRHYRLW